MARRGKGEPPSGTEVDWLADLEEHRVQYVVVDKGEDRELVDCIRSAPEWVVDLEDGQAVLFARRPAWPG